MHTEQLGVAPMTRSPLGAKGVGNGHRLCLFTQVRYYDVPNAYSH